MKYIICILIIIMLSGCRTTNDSQLFILHQQRLELIERRLELIEMKQKIQDEYNAMSTILIKKMMEDKDEKYNK